MHEYNESLFNIVISYVILVIVIFYCANIKAFHMADLRFSDEGR